VNVIKADPADAYRVNVNGQRWYADPLASCVVAPAAFDARFPSVSAVKKAAAQDWTSVTLHRLATALDDNPDMYARMDVVDIKALMTHTDKSALNAAGLRGTNVHTIIEQIAAGVPLSINEGMPGYNYFFAADRMLAALDAEFLHTECVLFNRSLHGHGFGGTCDAIVKLPDGRTVIVDWKSRGSANTVYGAEKQQLGLYSKAEYIIVDGKRRPMPVIDGLIIASLTPEGHLFYDIDIDQAQAAGVALHAWWVQTLTDRDGIAKGVKSLPKIATVAVDPPLTAAVVLTPQEQHAAVSSRFIDGDDDEGGQADTAAYILLEQRYKELDKDGRDWISDIARQATQHGVGFHSSSEKTVRRFEILRGLVMLATVEPDDETVRCLLERTIGDVAHFEALTVGHLVGTCTANEAKAFALDCHMYVDGYFTARCDTNGRVRLLAA
jgi:hypothetical protein